MNSVQTVTLNSALSQNWVGCTVRTPRTQVARTLRAQCPCRGRCCAHSKLVARCQRRSGVHLSRHAQAACSRPGRDIVPGRDLLEASPMSGHQIGVATPLRTIQVATSRRGRDTVSLPTLPPMSRPRNDVAT